MLPKSARLSHVALAVHNLDACEKFYNLLGMQTELKTPDYIYLIKSGDSLSLHKVSHAFIEHQRLEHIGFVRHEVTLQTVAANSHLHATYCSVSSSLLKHASRVIRWCEALRTMNPRETVGKSARMSRIF